MQLSMHTCDIPHVMLGFMIYSLLPLTHCNSLLGALLLFSTNLPVLLSHSSNLSFSFPPSTCSPFTFPLTCLPSLHVSPVQPWPARWFSGAPLHEGDGEPHPGTAADQGRRHSQPRSHVHTHGPWRVMCACVHSYN